MSSDDSPPRVNQESSEQKVDEADSSSSLVHLGFALPLTAHDEEDRLSFIGHRQPNYNDWDGGQLGGRPSWLEPQHVPQCVTCPICCRHSADSSHDHRMNFVCQIYAPLDDKPQAYHRSLYVFACPTCCSSSSAQTNDSDDSQSTDHFPSWSRGIRVLRAQLPKNNPYYPPSNPQDEINWTRHLSSEHQTRLCAVCGLAARHHCPLQKQFFCSATHQKEYKRYIFNTLNNDPSNLGNVTVDELTCAQLLPSLYPLSEVVVEEEPPPIQDTQHPKEDTDDEDEGDDSDQDLEQKDFNEIIASGRGKKKHMQKLVNEDPVTMNFYSRLKDRPNVAEQCLRYCRWPETTREEAPEDDELSEAGVLWFQTSGRPDATSCANEGSIGSASSRIPPCQYCHAPRKFEFQLMPQMLHFLLDGKSQGSTFEDANGTGIADDGLKAAIRQTEAIMEQAPPEMVSPVLVDAKDAAIERVQKCLLENKKSQKTGPKNRTNELDWGVVAVYTCTKSCGEESGTNEGDIGLGVYREEFAWRQPADSF